MKYYRKAAAIFIVFIALMLPFVLRAEPKVAVVDLNSLIDQSQEIGSLIEKNDRDKTNKEKIRKLTAEAAAELAAENNYSSVITKKNLYKGGEDITSQLAEKIDNK